MKFIATMFLFSTLLQANTLTIKSEDLNEKLTSIPQDISTSEMDNFVGDPKQSIYSKIKAMYDSGSLVDLNTVNYKLASGRCFEEIAPDKPLATYLTANKLVTDVGPIEPPIEKFEAMLQYSDSLAPSYFDSMAVGINDKEVSNNRFPAILSDERTYAIFYPSGSVSFLRQSGSYIVAFLRDKYEIKSQACYYFKIH